MKWQEHFEREFRKHYEGILSEETIKKSIQWNIEFIGTYISQAEMSVLSSGPKEHKPIEWSDGTMSCSAKCEICYPKAQPEKSELDEQKFINTIIWAVGVSKPEHIEEYKIMAKAIVAKFKPAVVPSEEELTGMIEDYIADVESGIRYLEHCNHDFGLGKDRLRMKAQAILEHLRKAGGQ